MTIDITNLPCFPVYNILPNGKCSCNGKPNCAPGKHPKGAWKTNYGYVKEKNFAANNYGIPMGKASGVIVIDYDPRNDLDGKSLDKFEAKIGSVLNETITVNTPSGGWHKYYEIPEDVDFPMKANMKDFPGIDFQGEGKYVIAEGSNHLKGVYKFAEGYGPDDVPLEILQPEILAFIEGQANKEAESNLTQGQEKISIEKLNEINVCLTKLEVTDRDQWVQVGMALHSIGNHGDKPFQLWKSWSQTNDKQDRWKDRDVRTWNSFGSGNINYKKIFKLAKEQGINPATVMGTPEMPGIDESIENLKTAQTKVIELEIDKKVSFKNGMPPGYAGELIEAIHDQLQQTTPLHVTITLVSQVLPATVFQGYICTPIKSGAISAFNLIIGPQGSGKTDTINNLHQLRRFIMQKEPKGQFERQRLGLTPWPASGGALMKSFGTYNPMMITSDELLTKLHTCYHKDKNGDGMLGDILSAWSCSSDGVGLMGQVAQDEKYDQKPVENPILSMFGGGVSSQWHKLSSDDDFMSRGIGTRFEITEWGKLIVPTNKDRINRKIQIVGHLEDLLCRQRDLYQSLRDNPDINKGSRLPAKASKKVMDMAYEFFLENIHKVNARDVYQTDMNESRLYELALRSATRLACLEAMATPNGKNIHGLEITEDMMQWSIDYVRNRFEIAEQEANQDRSPDSLFKDKVVNYIKKKPNGATINQIMRSPGKRSTLSPKEKRDAIQDLVNSRDIDLKFGLYLPKNRKPTKIK